MTGSKVSASGWREGICGTCGITVNGRPHGPVPNTTTYQQHVRSFKHGQTALDFAVCIGWGACVAACPNGSGNLFTGAKLAHLSLLPHGQQEREHRAQSMGAQADARIRALHAVRRMRTSMSGRNPDHRRRCAKPRAAARLADTQQDAR